MAIRRISVGLVAACGILVAGCGSTTVNHVTTTITRSASTAATSSSTSSSATTASRTRAPAARSALAGSSPRAIIDRAAGALRGSGGYSMQADLLQGGKRSIVDLTADSSTRYEATLTIGATMFQVIALPGSVYLRGNAAFWTAQAHGQRSTARQLAGHWLTVPASGRRSVSGSLGTLAPGPLARCLTEDHGSLTIAGHATVGGQRAVIVHDAGNAPGSTPSTYAIAATGQPYLLRYDATGATRAGGRVDICNDGKGDGATGTITLNQFGSVPTVQAPASAGSAPGSAT